MPYKIKFKWLEAIPDESKLLRKLKKIVKLREKECSLMVDAASENHLQIVTELIDKHSVATDAADKSKDGMTALQAACRNGHVDMIELLVNRGANLEQEDDKGRRAIHYAVEG